MHPVHRFVRHRPRLIVAIAIGAAIAFALPSQWQFISRFLIGWNVGVWAYLALIGWMMLHADHVRIRQLAAQEDKSGAAVLAIMSIAAVASLAAIVLELSTVKEMTTGFRAYHYLLTAVTLIGSWLLVGVTFTFHYASMFYRASSERRPIIFPEGEQQPNYWDFLYFAFTIAVAAQTADINIQSRSMRKAVLAQSVLSFLFNAAILGFSINIAAGLV
ncbi:DUF1345 domain-containing protein [Undibacterium arcticum]|uniref:DUF1345 domain-containing protein n=1 Tax=Undibacterium arcticum TaxID=1762892 RepID=A0ABV7FAL1_9BURK